MELRTYIFLFTLVSSQDLLSAAFQSANAPGAIGKTGSLFLFDQGFFARPFYNDVFGHTDKEKFGSHQLQLPVGRYADWMEVQMAHAGLFEFQGLMQFTKKLDESIHLNHTHE